MKLAFSKLSEQDLDAIFLYISKTLHNPTAANNTVRGIINLATQLLSFPKLGAVLELPNFSDIEIRYALYGNYLVPYLVEPTQLTIVRILYARSDYIKLLGK